MPRFVEPRTELGRVLRRLRQKRGLTAPELADRTGLSKSYIGNLETGYPVHQSRAIAPRLATLRRLSEVLGEGSFELLELAARELREPRLHRRGLAALVRPLEREIRGYLAQMSPAHREMVRKMAQALAEQDIEVGDGRVEGPPEGPDP